MAREVDWRRATFVGAVIGGLFWGLAAGAVLASKASPSVITVICIVAVGVVIAGAFVFRRSINPRNRALGIGLILAPITGLVPMLTLWLPGIVTHASSWGR
ncbi:hypothetical protein [Mycobacterium sp. DL592]|uniref:hypothetical protein n=1 Tax=Mycobacterium sp. DL592 TaxID=2675524 RepID=UPI00142063ED|nr:hypothetical protein [Mycobacterium sp. DL592]